MPRQGKTLLNYTWGYLAVAAACEVLLGAAQEYHQAPPPRQGGAQPDYRPPQPASKVFFPDKWNSNIYARDKGVVKDLTKPPDPGYRGGYSNEPPRYHQYERSSPPPPPPPHPPVPQLQGGAHGSRGGGHDYGDALGRAAAAADHDRVNLQPSQQTADYKARFPDGGLPKSGHLDCGHGARTSGPTRTRDVGPTSQAGYRDTPKKYASAETAYRQEHFESPSSCQQHTKTPAGPVGNLPFYQQNLFTSQQLDVGQFGPPANDFYGGNTYDLITGGFPSTNFNGGDYFGHSGAGYGALQDPVLPDAYQSKYTSVSFNTAGSLAPTDHDFGSSSHSGTYLSPGLADSKSAGERSTEEPMVEVLKTEVMALPASQIVFDIPPSNDSRLVNLPAAEDQYHDPLVGAASSSNAWTVPATLVSNRTTNVTTTSSVEPTVGSAASSTPTLFVTPPSRASRRSVREVMRASPPTMLLMKLHGRPRGKIVVLVPEDAPPTPAPRRVCPCERSRGRRQRDADVPLDDNIAVEGAVSLSTAVAADFRNER